MSKPGITMVDGSSAGFHLSSLEVWVRVGILQNAIRHKAVTDKRCKKVT